MALWNLARNVTAEAQVDVGPIRAAILQRVNSQRIRSVIRVMMTAVTLLVNSPLLGQSAGQARVSVILKKSVAAHPLHVLWIKRLPMVNHVGTRANRLHVLPASAHLGISSVRR